MDDGFERTRAALAKRFGEATPEIAPAEGPQRCPELWPALAARGSCRYFQDRRVAPELIDTLCALALSAPSKSDLQQRDIVIVEDRGIRTRIDQLLTNGPLAQAWIPGAPAMLVFCGNHRRQRQIHEWRGKPFANDHLDAFFNAAVDAGIALTAFVLAADSAGLGSTPISAIRNHAEEVSQLLGLPDHVFPVAGLGVGWPLRKPHTSLRLPLNSTVHRDRFSEEGIEAAVDAYDRRRDAVAPYREQRAVDRFGKADFYGWSEDKVRQYAGQERANWGRFVRAKGFRLD
jgi:nitroreductase/FMN reductase [NAD(P)H]